MTLELKQYPNWATKAEQPMYQLGGVEEITDKTEYGEGHFAIVIFDRRIFSTSCFEYVRDANTGEYFVRDGKWCDDA